MKTSRKDGFSLVEIMVILSIVAISVTLYLPFWNETRSKREVTAAAEELHMFLSYGRSLAVMHNRNVAASLVKRDS